MIEQLQYTITSRYNFPRIIRDTELNKRLTEASLRTMHNVREKTFQPFETQLLEQNEQNNQQVFHQNLEGKSISTFLTPLTAIEDQTPIVGIDVSGIRLGETETGILCAVRGAIVWNLNQNYRYLRIGPFPFHITEENRQELFNHLENGTLPEVNPSHMPLFEVIGRLCNQVERWIQTTIAYSAAGSIILWDGSLTTGTSGNSVSEVSYILKTARKHENAVLAFTKVTTIRFLSWKITDIVANHEPPCLFEVDDLPLSISKNTHLLGRIYVANLATGGSAFRLDIDKGLSREDNIMAVQRLLGNELLFQGYPECLRLAHIYSTFTANDVIGIQSFLAHEYGLKIVPRNNMRKVLFGPFGTGFED
ncbi:hypothetical protein KEJ18_04870 [Candidatus Bathyarchaeota archaeon]|nr:hypothetical protein [Candidatus Bathyarchaeota archaeon]